MSTAPSRDLAQENEPEGGPSSEYTRLRELLLGPEKARLEELQRRLDDRQMRTEDLSQVVAEAIALRSRRDRALQQTLNPLVEEAVRISVTRDPGILANVLFPVIGEAVRKAVAHALRGLVESINQTLERSVSLAALKWRIEALRTGRPFGEIVLARSVRYRVEQVFLIHRETGLLLQHVARSDQVIQDSDMVSGMLTAIQDFVRDSFTGTSGQEIDTIELGEFNLWVQHGPTAILAAVVSGTPPPELRNILERTLERVHAEYSSWLTSFNGDATAFGAARPLLESCLLGRQTQKPARQSKAFFVVSAAALLLVIGFGIFLTARSRRRWDHLVERLRQEPGIILTGADRSWSSYELVGLRDPLSTDPAKLIRASGIDPAKVTSRWEPYVSLDAKFKFFRQFLGEKDAVEQAVLRFPLNSVQLSAEQLAKLDDIEAHIVKLQRDAAAVGQKFVIELHGHTDPTGNEDKNATLSQRRAEEVAKALVGRGISKDMLRTVAMGSREPVRAAAAYLTELNRRVTFHVVFENEAGP
ncbi:MAG TPA: OmpA family protein [Terriglobales bacterium]|jgi:OOP family OmpA-OmpF porin|nr:OmpA family protein [Terriglobales bacterium]